MINLSISQTQDSYQYHSKAIKDLCKLVLNDTSYESISIEIIFCDDNHLSKLKMKYFNEDVLTDVLAFPIKNDAVLESEIYISYDRALANSKEFDVSLNNEIVRLIVHGLLHLLGYRDDNAESKKIMFDKQESIVESCNIKIV
ncbi:MAG: rRNA maturation RNase YbeY [Candidatus Neomarinimicrobiota bacterium]|nr:rRNA maturation RNase YbeY [Candidatus Neomarinimicrobiota bacterium]